MLHTKFHGNQPASSRGEIFEGFTIYGHGGHLGHVTSIMSSLIRFSFFEPESCHTKNLVQNGTVLSEKILFEFLYVHDLGPRSRNDLDLKTHIPS